MKFVTLVLICCCIVIKLNGHPQTQGTPVETAKGDGANNEKNKKEEYPVELMLKCISEELVSKIKRCDEEAGVKMKIPFFVKNSQIPVDQMGEEKKIQSDTENVDEETIKLFLLTYILLKLAGECHFGLENGVMNKTTRELDITKFFNIFSDKSSLSSQQKSSVPETIKSCMMEEIKDISLSLPIIFYSIESSKTGFGKAAKKDGKQFVSLGYAMYCVWKAFIKNGCSDSSVPIIKMIQGMDDYVKIKLGLGSS